ARWGAERKDEPLIEKTITINFLATDHGAAAAAIEAITRAVESAPGEILRAWRFATTITPTPLLNLPPAPLPASTAARKESKSETRNQHCSTRPVPSRPRDRAERE